MPSATGNSQLKQRQSEIHSDKLLKKIVDNWCNIVQYGFIRLVTYVILTLLIDFFKWIHPDFLHLEDRKNEIYDQIQFQVVEHTTMIGQAITRPIVLRKWLMCEPERSSEWKSERAKEKVNNVTHFNIFICVCPYMRYNCRATLHRVCQNGDYSIIIYFAVLRVYHCRKLKCKKKNWRNSVLYTYHPCHIRHVNKQNKS